MIDNTFFIFLILSLFISFLIRQNITLFSKKYESYGFWKIVFEPKAIKMCYINLMLYTNTLDAIGNTPLIKLNRISEEGCADIYGKFEAVNLGGSIKTRTAFNMINEAEKQGLLNENSVIVECTSGNQGIALAMIGAIKGYRVIIVMPDSVSVERRHLISMYGAQIRLVHDEGNIGECIAKCQKIVENSAREDPYVFVPGQFENPANVAAQRITGEEIAKDLQIGRAHV